VTARERFASRPVWPACSSRRCIWFPTVDAHAHAQAFGSTGAYPAQRGGIESPAGIRLRDGDGEIVGAAYEQGVAEAELGEALRDRPRRLLEG
jgi:hypothetical protein